MMDYLPTRPTALATVLCTLSLIAYVVGTSIYRLYLHPLAKAKIPGPKLAALTRWYEFYYEIVQQGRFTFHIQQLHDQYGPIIRICPDEIHIRDSEYFEDFYVKSGKLDKPRTFSIKFGTEDTFFSTIPHDHHKLRRGAVSQFFSKRKILDFQPVIRSKLKKLIDRLVDAKGTGQVVKLDRAFMAFAGDVVDQFSFGKSFDHLDSPGFEKTYHEPKFNRTITEIKEGVNDAYKEVEHPTLFHEMLNSQLPESEKTVLRMQQEALVVIGAAISTTSWAAAVAAFHLLSNPLQLKKLRAELVTAIPDATYLPAYDWPTLEALPYLTGVAKEGIRLAYGILSRLPRVPQKDLVYKDYIIPAGTTASMTVNGNSLEKYKVGFGKGPRSCIGLNLAQAELYILLAGVFRQIDFELFETDESDIIPIHDYFKPCPKFDSLGVRAKVTGVVK